MNELIEMTPAQFMEFYSLTMAQIAPYAVILAIASRMLKFIVKAISGKGVDL